MHWCAQRPHAGQIFPQQLAYTVGMWKPTVHFGCVRSTSLGFAGYLQSQEVPMVVVSHDREFLDQLCNKLVETEHGVATTYKGNYTEYVKTKEEKIGQQWAAWEKQQKEISRQVL